MNTQQKQFKLNYYSVEDLYHIHGVLLHISSLLLICRTY